MMGTVAWLLPLLAGVRALPRSCRVESLDDGFLLDEAATKACGLPSARSYLLAAHNLVLRLEATADPRHWVVRGCDGPARLPWRDVWSAPGPPDTDWCEPAELEVWARLRGPAAVDVAAVAPSARECRWDLRLPDALPGGTYAFDVLATWLRGGVDPKTPHYDAVNVRRGVAFTGEVFDWANEAGGALKRGSPFMLCGDRCMLYDQCAKWTQRKPGRPAQCSMFTSTNGTEPNSGGESGSRKDEPKAKHLGGLTNAGGQWPANLIQNKCRRQAHVAGSPATATVAPPPAPVPRPATGCEAAVAPGRWVGLDCDKDGGASCAEAERLEKAEKGRERAKKSDGDWDFGYAWQADGCPAAAPRSPEGYRDCFARRNLSHVFLSGDSVIQGCTPSFYELLGGVPREPDEAVARRAGIAVESVSMTMATDGKALKNLLRSLERAVKPGNLGVTLSNFGVQHVQWGKSAADTRATLEPFTKDAFCRFRKASPKVRTQFVQFGGVAVHGFREPYVTLARSKTFSELIRDRLAPLGWQYLDAWAMTTARPEGAQDGMHYRPPACAAMMAAFLGLVCEEGAAEAAGCEGHI